MTDQDLHPDDATDDLTPAEADDLEIVRLLLDRGADPDATNRQGQKPAELAGEAAVAACLGAAGPVV